MSKFFFDHPQLPLLSDDDVSKLPIVKKYETLFDYLKLSAIKDHNDGVGCSGYSRHALIKAFIIKEQEQIPSIPKLIWFLQNQPYLTKYIIGFKSTIPDQAVFYRFLNEFPGSKIQQLIADTNLRTFKQTDAKIETTSTDSKPIKANTKENNPKNFNHNLSDKNKKPKRNEQATLSHFSSTNDINGKVKKEFFWGYRVHIIFGGNDQVQLPLIIKLHPNNVVDEKAAPTLFRKLKQLYHVSKKNKTTLLADKAYDCRHIYELWDKLFGGRAVIPTNQRNTKESLEIPPICQAGLKMKFHSSWLEQKAKRKRFRYCCPNISKDCPFRKGKGGCAKYRQITETPPAKVYQFEKLFKELYPKRQGIERYNSVLQHLGEETPNHFEQKTIENTILFAVLGTALIAGHNARQKHNDKDPPTIAQTSRA